MFTKVNIMVLVGAGIALLISIASSVYGTYKVTRTLDELNKQKVTLTEEKVSDIVINDLTQKVEANEKITTTSLERLEALKKEVDSKPETVTIIKTEVVQATPQKDFTHETPEPVSNDSLDIAYRAVDELWRDYCERFPGERDCRNREDHSR